VTASATAGSDSPPLLALRYREALWPLVDATVLIVGRAPDCNIVVDAPGISRRHAHIETHGGETTVQDLGSRNGVRVNGSVIAGATAITLGDRIEIGDVPLQVVRASRGDVLTRPTEALAGVEGRRERETSVTPAATNLVSELAASVTTAFAAGRVEAAAAAAQQLHDMLMTNPASPGCRDWVSTASDLLARVAVATERPEWLERLFALRLAFESPMDLNSIRALTHVARTIHAVPTAARSAYLTWLKAQPMSFTERSAVEELAGAM
jgi:pSer/pThr/pTyr-binding forkhead associated (FHA) protein